MVHPVAEANEESPFGTLSPSEFYAHHNVSHSSSFITNSRGLKIFTQSWIPLPPTKTIGIVALIHGFTGESSFFIQLTAIHFTKFGFATCAIDHQGHGFSQGLQCHIPDINPVVDDCISFFDSFRSQYPSSIPSFLYAESLGGAIALLIHLRHGNGNGNGNSSQPWNGIVLNGAMCGISPKFKPPWPLEHFLFVLAWFAPTRPVIPTRGSIPNVSFKEEWKRKLARASPGRTHDPPRAATALELLRICREVQGRSGEVDVPLLIVHGGDDKVCDPACVEELHRKAASKDKTIRIYPGMWHQLVGEPQENVELVYGDIVEWLLERADPAWAANCNCKSGGGGGGA